MVTVHVGVPVGVLRTDLVGGDGVREEVGLSVGLRVNEMVSLNVSDGGESVAVKDSVTEKLGAEGVEKVTVPGLGV